MAFTGHENHSIPTAVAAQFTRNYRDQNNAAGNPALVRAVFFGKDALLGALNQPECVGLRCYFAIDEDGTSNLVIVGASSDQNDILAPGATVLDYGFPCPPWCTSIDSPL